MNTLQPPLAAKSPFHEPSLDDDTLFCLVGLRDYLSRLPQNALTKNGIAIIDRLLKLHQ